MKERLEATLSFHKSTGGIQVLMTVRGAECFGRPVGPRTFFLRGGKEMLAVGALEYAKSYVTYHKATPGDSYSYVIDESGLE